MRISIRKASLADLDWLIAELKNFSRAFASKRELLGDEAHARRFVSHLIQDHVVLISEAHNELENPIRTGMIAGTFGAHPYNPEISVLSELFWWVSEEFRGTRSGLLLLDVFLGYGKDFAHWVTVSLEAESPVRDRVLLRRGFRPKEQTYFLEAR